MPRYALDHPRWSPAAILESMARDVRKLVRMFKNHWYSVGEVGGEVRRNCLVYAIHCMTPNCFTTRDIVVGAALASRSDQLGWRQGQVTRDSYIRVAGQGVRNSYCLAPEVIQQGLRWRYPAGSWLWLGVWKLPGGQVVHDAREQWAHDLNVWVALSIMFDRNQGLGSHRRAQIPNRTPTRPDGRGGNATHWGTIWDRAPPGRRGILLSGVPRDQEGGWHYFVVWEGGFYDTYWGDYTYSNGLWNLGDAWERVDRLYGQLHQSYFVVTPSPDDVQTTAGATMRAYSGSACNHMGDFATVAMMDRMWYQNIRMPCNRAPHVVATLEADDCATPPP